MRICVSNDIMIDVPTAIDIDTRYENGDGLDAERRVVKIHARL